MKWNTTSRIVIACIAILLMAGKARSQDCSVDNLITNGGFESALSGWQVLGAATSAADPYSGSLAAGTPGSSVQLVQEFPASPGEAFTVGAYAKVSGSASVLAILQFEDAGGNLLKSVYEQVNSSEYAYYAFSASAPPNSDHAVITLSKQGTGSAEFDAVCVLSLNVNDPVAPTAATSCTIMPDADQYVFSMDASGTDAAWMDYDIGSLILAKGSMEATDLVITGTILNGRDADWSAGTGPECTDGDAWEITLNLTNRETWGNSSGEYDGAVYQDAGCEVNKTEWYFYDVAGSMTGIGCNTGRTITITGSLPGYKLQIGEGGNAHSCDFGLSGRMMGVEGVDTVNMDIYAHVDESCFLNANCANPPVVSATWSADFNTVTANSDIHHISNIVMVFDDGSHEQIEYNHNYYSVTESGNDDNSGKCITGVYIKASCNFSGAESGYGQYVANPDWNGSCADLFIGDIINLCGSNKSIVVESRSLSSGDACMVIADVSQVTRVIAEVWLEKTDCSDGELPTAIALISGSDTISARLIKVKRAGGLIEEVGIYRNEFSVQVSSVCVDAPGCIATSMALYIERSDANAVSSLDSDSTELEGAGDCYTSTLEIDASKRTKDIEFYVPLHGMNNGESVDITITGFDHIGNAAIIENFSFSGINARGASLHQLSIDQVEGDISIFEITVCTNSTGDRIGVGALVASCTESCSMDYGLDIYKEVSQDTAVAGDTVIYIFEIEKVYDFDLADFTFTDVLTDGMVWVSEPFALSSGLVLGATSVTGSTIAEFDVISLPLGLSSFEIKAVIPQPYFGPDPNMNQAWLTGLPYMLDHYMASDYPETPAIDDPTPLFILGQNECIGEWNLPVIEVDFSYNHLSADVSSTRPLMNIVLEFSDGTIQKFSGLSGYSGNFAGSGVHEDKCIIGLWTRTLCNASGEGPEYGEYQPNYFWDGFCITDGPPIIQPDFDHGSTVLNDGPQFDLDFDLTVITDYSADDPEGGHNSTATGITRPDVPGEEEDDRGDGPDGGHSNDEPGYGVDIDLDDLGLRDNLPFAEAQLEIYPNPVRTNGYVNIRGLTEHIWNVHIYSISGSQLASERITSANELDISRLQLKPGIYMLHFENGAVSVGEKIIVQ